MRLEVVVHQVEQAKIVLHVAEQTGFDVQLRSAAGAASSAGVGYLHALGEAAGREIMVDCADDAGLAMAAMRAGCRKLLFSGAEDERRYLSDIAKSCYAELCGPTEQPSSYLTLSPTDDEAAFRIQLKAFLGCSGDHLKSSHH